MKKRLEVKVPELPDRIEVCSSEEYDSSGMGRMEITEGGECSFGLEAASPIPPALSDRQNLCRQPYAPCFRSLFLALKAN